MCNLSCFLHGFLGGWNLYSRVDTMLVLKNRYKGTLLSERCTWCHDNPLVDCCVAARSSDDFSEERQTQRRGSIPTQSHVWRSSEEIIWQPCYYKLCATVTWADIEDFHYPNSGEKDVCHSLKCTKVSVHFGLDMMKILPFINNTILMNIFNGSQLAKMKKYIPYMFLP